MNEKKILRRLYRSLETRRWVSLLKLHEERIAYLLKSKPDVFDEAYFEKIFVRKIELEKAFWKLSALSIVLFAFLAGKIFGGLSINVAGIAITDYSNFKGPIIFIIATIGVVNTYQKNQIDLMNGSLKVWARSFAGKSDNDIFLLKWGDAFGQMPIIKSHNENVLSTFIQKLIYSSIVLSQLFLLSMLAMSAIYINIIVIDDIYNNPGNKPYLTYLIIVYVIFAWISNFAMEIVKVAPLPIRDIGPLKEHNRLFHENRPEFDRITREKIRQILRG